jgi:tetratricopeptide (TPR) repeat protein
VPYIGLFFIVATGFAWLWNQEKGKWKNFRMPAAIALGIMAIAFTYINFQQAKVWTNGETLWTQAINSFPVARTYGNRADYYDTEGMREKALPDLNTALQIKGPDPGYLLTRGTLLFDMGRDQDAMNDFLLGMKNNPDEKEKCELYVNMGSVYGRLGNYPKSLESFNQALLLEPKSKNGLINRGILLSLQGDLDGSLADYLLYLESHPGDPDYRVFNGIGTVYFNKGQHARALPYFTQAIETGKGDGQTYMNRSQCHFILGDKPSALQDAKTAQQKGYNVPQAYVKQVEE